MKLKNINRIFSALASIKLALILLILIAVISGLSTFVIQGESDEFYYNTYPLLGRLFVYIGFTNFFRSIFFIALMALFFINLSLCTIKRVYKEFKGIIELRFGPDLIHIGLLMLIVGGSINIILEQKVSVMLTAGDEISVGGFSITLNNFEFEKYDNGTPKDWISDISVKNIDGQIIKENILIEVNKPLRFKGLSLFQSSYNVINSVVLENNDKEVYTIKSGYMFESLDNTYILDDVVPGKSGLFQVIDRNENIKYIEFKVGDTLGEYSVFDSSRLLSSGILIKKEPGYILNYIALIIMLLGFSVTYIQKIGVEKR